MSDSPAIRLPPPESSPGGEPDAGRLLHILWRGKWILVIVPALAYLGARLWLDAQTVLYQASAQIQVDSREVNPLRGGAGDAMAKPRTVLKQQQQLLRSTNLLRPIAESPALSGLRTFAPERLGGTTLVGELYTNLGTTIDVESDRLILSYRSPWREEAELVVSEAVRVYIDYHKQKKSREVEVVTGILRTEWERNKQELEQATRLISDLRAENLLPAGTERTPLQTQLDNAAAALNSAHLETLEKQAVHEELLRASLDAVRFRESGRYWRATRPIASLEEQQDAARREREEKQAEYERKRQRFGPANPELTALEERIAELRALEDEITLSYARDYLHNTEVDHRTQQAVEARLEAELLELRGRIVAENRVQERLTDLELLRVALRDVIARFGERITELEVENQTGALNLDVIEQARAAVRPVFPEVEKILLYALGAGTALAFGLVLLLGLSDRSVRDVEEVPRLLGTSVLGVLPELAGGDRTRIARLVEEEPHSLLAEAIRSARTATTFALPAGRGIVLVTSPRSGEGKSVCASNLACSLARAGKRTLLVDADMRRPAQHTIYGVANGVGLAGLLASSAPLKKAIVPNAAAGLDLLPAGDAQGRAAELCAGQVLHELLRSLRESYECVVIDSPAVLEAAEARVLASLSDVVVFVLRLDVSKAPGVKRAAGILRSVGARLLGCLPNGARSRRGAQDFAGGISYGETPENPGAPGRAVEVAAGAEPPTHRGTDFLGLEETSEVA